MSKVIFLVAQRPAGPSVSTAPNQPSDCFMFDPNRLINHSPSHYGYSVTQISHKITGTCSIAIVELHNRTIVGSVSAYFLSSLLKFLIQFLTIILCSFHFNLPTRSISLIFLHPFFPVRNSQRGTDDEDWELSRCHIFCNHSALIQLV